MGKQNKYIYTRISTKEEGRYEGGGGRTDVLVRRPVVVAFAIRVVHRTVFCDVPRPLKLQ